MKVRDVMTPDVVTVNPYTPFQKIVELLLRHDISGVPVLNGGELVGIVTEADLVALEAHQGRRRRPLAVLAALLSGEVRSDYRSTGFTAHSLMTADPVTVAPDEDLRSAARTMVAARVKRLPVIENGKLVGIVTRQDLLRLYSRTDEEIAADVVALLESSHLAPEVTGAVEHGVVILEGRVEDDARRGALPAMVEMIPGVVSAVNLVSVDKSGGSDIQ